jgi:aspartyl-tRNA(Asn)/glutamyl-tRNA(Gln) amidotransferase subunit B
VTELAAREEPQAFEPVIGLEVHVQLATGSKLFSAAAAAFGGEPNTATDPVVLGMPGTLPVLNRAAVEMAVRFGLAVGGHIRPRCRFARKHYFYPDLPKGFQTSQYDEPLVEGGTVAFRLRGELRRVRLTRIHLEEDAGKLVHAPGGASFVDYNRAGVPLCEAVSEPDLRSAEEASEYLRAVRTLVRYLGISDGNMEEGSLRCDANVSLRPRGATQLGTKTELKNINSFKNVKEAIEHEIKRQGRLLERGERVIQETRLWDANRGVSASMRSKEDAHDYRYFPEPDLPPLEVDEMFVARVKAALPELPEERFARYTTALLLGPQDAGVLVSEKEIADYFDAALAAAGAGQGKKVANWVINEVLGRVADARTLHAADLPVPPAALAELVDLLEQGTVSGKQAKEVFGRMWLERRGAREIVQSERMSQLSDTDALEAACRRVIDAHPEEAARYRAGRGQLLGFFVGQVLKQTGGQANPKVVSEILRRLLA